MKDYIKESKMDFSMSISNTVSKGTATEEMSFFFFFLEDEASRLADGIKHETIAGTVPEEKYKTSEENKIEDLPALPDKIQNHSIYYSADGLLLLLVDQKQKTSEPWLRLYWDYEPRKEADTAEEQKKEKQKPKGLFARIFGR